MENNDSKVLIPNNLNNNIKYNSFIYKIFKNFQNITILVLFILLIYIKIKFYLFKLKNSKNNIEYELGNHSIYSSFQYPQISILIPKLEELKIDNNNIINLLINLKNQKLIDIQILLSSSKSTNNNIKLNKSLNDTRIEIYYYKNNNLIDNIYYLINKIKGKFTIIMDKFMDFKKYELLNYYNFTKGKINNIFIFKTKDGKNLYLIKTKILKDIVDNKLIFKNYTEIIKYITSLSDPQVIYLPLSFALNNYYSPSLYVSMISILNSKNYYTFILFYLIISKDYTKKNKNLLESLYDQYDYFNITFIKMDDRYDKAFISRYISKETYYRFSLGELIPNLNKIIYLDTDIIVFKDLIKLYNLNFNGKIFLGQLSCANKSPKTGVYNINAGVLLLDLYEMRKKKIEKKVLDIIKLGYKNKFHDQGLLNQFFKKYIGIIPPEYNTRPFKNYHEIIKFNKDSGSLYNNDYIYFSWKYPSIRHYLGYSKPIYNNTNNRDDWWYFASISKYFIKKGNNYSRIFNHFYK